MITFIFSIAACALFFIPAAHAEDQATSIDAQMLTHFEHVLASAGAKHSHGSPYFRHLADAQETFETLLAGANDELKNRLITFTARLRIMMGKKRWTRTSTINQFSAFLRTSQRTLIDAVQTEKEKYLIAHLIKDLRSLIIPTLSSTARTLSKVPWVPIVLAAALAGGVGYMATGDRWQKVRDHLNGINRAMNICEKSLEVAQSLKPTIDNALQHAPQALKVAQAYQPTVDRIAQTTNSAIALTSTPEGKAALREAADMAKDGLTTARKGVDLLSTGQVQRITETAIALIGELVDKQKRSAFAEEQRLIDLGVLVRDPGSKIAIKNPSVQLEHKEGRDIYILPDGTQIPKREIDIPMLLGMAKQWTDALTLEGSVFNKLLGKADVAAERVLDEDAKYLFDEGISTSPQRVIFAPHVEVHFDEKKNMYFTRLAKAGETPNSDGNRIRVEAKPGIVVALTKTLIAVTNNEAEIKAGAKQLIDQFTDPVAGTIAEKVAVFAVRNPVSSASPYERALALKFAQKEAATLAAKYSSDTIVKRLQTEIARFQEGEAAKALKKLDHIKHHILTHSTAAEEADESDESGSGASGPANTQVNGSPDAASGAGSPATLARKSNLLGNLFQ